MIDLNDFIKNKIKSKIEENLYVVCLYNDVLFVVVET